MIYVTKPYLPSIEKYKKYVDDIYASNHLTNNGPLVQGLEKRLAEYLGVENLVLVSNGTLALQVAYKLLKLKGEVITTPFSFVASTSSLVWENLNPVFADIDAKTLNLDPSLIESEITDKTSAIMPVHVFGNPCAIEEIEKIGEKHNLKIIYDASHAFGIKYKEKSIFSHGDISTLSFHATKLFHTIEGGALVIKDKNLVKEAKEMICFGLVGDAISRLGINAKMNEFQAAMGLAVLDEMEVILSARKEIYERYFSELKGFVEFQKLNSETQNFNYHYVPVILKSETELLKIRQALNAKAIFPRRYFYPSLDTVAYLSGKQKCEVSRDISSRILCLPIYPGLESEEQEKIIKIVKENL